MSSAAAVAGVALMVAACGSSSSNNGGTSAAAGYGAGSATASAPVSAGNGAGVSVGLASGADGRYLVGPSGRTLYLWDADGSGQSSCMGACAKFWPPVTTKAAPVAAGGVSASQLSTITRSDGTKQVTYDSHPLYYFALDHSKGSIKGQGSDNFGAKWWLVAPSGTAITRTGGASGAASGSASSGGWG